MRRCSLQAPACVSRQHRNQRDTLRGARGVLCILRQIMMTLLLKSRVVILFTSCTKYLHTTCTIVDVCTMTTTPRAAWMAGCSALGRYVQDTDYADSRIIARSILASTVVGLQRSVRDERMPELSSLNRKLHDFNCYKIDSLVALYHTPYWWPPYVNKPAQRQERPTSRVSPTLSQHLTNRVSSAAPRCRRSYHNVFSQRGERQLKNTDTPRPLKL